VQTCIIFNPSARGEKAERFCSRLVQLHPQGVLWRTGAQGDARTLAARAASAGFATVVAAGGDGTANEVLNGIADVPNGLAVVRLGILPLGTVNVFARELGVPRDVGGAVKTLAAGRERTIDVGRVDFTSGGRPERRYFLQLAGAGIDSRSIERVSWTLKKKTGPFAYVAAVLQVLPEKEPLIILEGAGSISGELVLVGNGRFYGGSFPVFPSADMRDGLLDVCVFPKISLWSAIHVTAALLTGRLHRLRTVRRLQLASLRLSSASRVVFQLDGENVGELPATFSVQPRALRVVVP
jgi:YegS/Rv2252/BmrU family lipid kinase